MMLGNIGLLKGIMAKMSWLDQNQQVIAQNVANSDTPGYRPSTLKEVDFASYMGAAAGGASAKLGMAASDSKHFGAASGGQAKTAEALQKHVYEASPDDNGVVLEEQLYKASQNNMQYQLATDLYRRNVGMLRMAVQGVGR